MLHTKRPKPYFLSFCHFSVSWCVLVGHTTCIYQNNLSTLGSNLTTMTFCHVKKMAGPITQFWETLGTELLKTYELRFENAAEYFYARGLYVDPLSSSRTQSFLHGEGK